VSRSRSVLLNIARYTTTNATYVASGVSASEKREWPRRGGSTRSLRLGPDIGRHRCLNGRRLIYRCLTHIVA
jgi:hypothetical protein